MLSRYTIIVPAPESGDFVLYNTLYNTMVCVEPELFADLKQDEKANACLRARYQEEIGTLKDMGIVQSEGTDEREALQEWFRCFQNDSSRMSINILTTYCCNLACTYCFEEGRKKGGSMDDETAHYVASWIKAKARHTGTREMRLAFYGGEPLVHVKPMEIIMRETRKFGEAWGIKIQTGVITNGALLDRAMTLRLRSWGVDFAKITLDGIGKAHDRKRPARNGKGTFDVIMKNLQEVRGLIGLSITCNFDDENFESAISLPSYLHDVGLQPHISRLRFKPIKDTDRLIGQGGSGCTMGGYTAEEANRMMELRKELVRNNYEVDEDFSLGPCEFHHFHSLTIDVKGDVYPCGSFPGIREFILGNVREHRPEEINKERLLQGIPDICQECPYFPSCGGGCRYLSYLKTSDISDITCELTYFEDNASGIMRETMQRQLAQV